MDQPPIPDRDDPPAQPTRALICSLHRRTARGLLETAAADAHLTGLVSKDPYRAGCLVEIEPDSEQER